MFPRSRVGIAVAIAFALSSPIATPLAAQGLTQAPAQSSNPADERIDPLLLRDAAQLQTNGFVRDLDRVRNNLRVVIEIVRQPGDVTFATSTARNPQPLVQAAVINRQALFLEALQAALTPQESAAVNVLFPLEYQYMVAAEIADVKTLRRVAAHPQVKYVWRDSLNKLLTNEGRQITGSAAQAAAGNTGSGVGVAVIDSNFDLLHPELGSSTSLPNSVVKGGYNYSTPGASIHSRNFNDCYHGTGTASIVKRYAPGCDLYTLVVFPNAYDSVIANAINWCVTNKNGTGGGAPIRVISMSLGGGQYSSEQTSGTMHAACGTALANDIICFAASGNDGWNSSMGSPAASTNTVSVGATWDQNGANYSPFPPAYCSDSSRQVDERTCYSDKASFLDIYCPSEEVICARCGGGTFALGGTSSACPAAAGLTAQLLQAVPSYVGNMSGLVTLYQSTGAQVIGDTSKRRVNLTAAIASAGGGGPGPGPTPLSNGTTANYSVATGAIQEFSIAVPANASNLVVTITGSGDADLYVKRAAINWPADQGSHNAAEFKAQYIGGSAESVTFASPAADTWNVLVHGYSGAAGTITATWSVSSGSASWNSVAWARDSQHNYRNNRTYSHTYSYPGASQVAIHFNRIDTEANYDFLRIKDGSGNVVFTVDGSNVINGGSGSAFGRTDGWAIVSGSSITVELVTDYSVTRWGYRTDTAAAYY